MVERWTRPWANEVWRAAAVAAAARQEAAAAVPWPCEESERQWPVQRAQSEEGGPPLQRHDGVHPGKSGKPDVMLAAPRATSKGSGRDPRGDGRNGSHMGSQAVEFKSTTKRSNGRYMRGSRAISSLSSCSLVRHVCALSRLAAISRDERLPCKILKNALAQCTRPPT